MTAFHPTNQPCCKNLLVPARSPCCLVPPKRARVPSIANPVADFAASTCWAGVAFNKQNNKRGCWRTAGAAGAKDTSIRQQVGVHMHAVPVACGASCGNDYGRLCDTRERDDDDEGTGIIADCGLYYIPDSR